MNKAEVYKKHKEEAEEASAQKQWDDILDLLELSVSEGKREIRIDSILYDVVREMLKTDGFFIETVLDSATDTVFYRISW